MDQTKSNTRCIFAFVALIIGNIIAIPYINYTSYIVDPSLIQNRCRVVSMSREPEVYNVHFTLTVVNDSRHRNITSRIRSDDFDHLLRIFNLLNNSRDYDITCWHNLDYSSIALENGKIVWRIDTFLILIVIDVIIGFILCSYSLNLERSKTIEE